MAMVHERNNPRTNRTEKGFTLLELMVVIAIMSILMGIAAGMYYRSLQRSKEAVLRQDLFTLRQAIDQFTLDKQRAPTSLEELISADYLRSLPVDPMTNQRDWQTVYEDVVLSADQSATGITNVHSASETVSPFEGTPYSSW
jgi:general secretion pathway protein G